MQSHGVVNGVNTDRLVETIDAIQKDPSLAQFRFRAKHKWLKGAHARTEIKDFYGVGKEDTSRKEAFHLEADEPGVLLGEDFGPNATEAVLHALASCLSATLVYHAAARGIQIASLELDLEGKLDLRGFLGLPGRTRNGYEQIDVTFRVDSDASDKELEELIRLAQRRSPVFDIVTNPVPVSVRMERKQPSVAETPTYH